MFEVNHRKKRLTAVTYAAIAGAISLGLAGCGGSVSGTTASGGGSAGSTIEVGEALSLTGANSAVDSLIGYGVEMAVKELNSKGGMSGHRINLSKADAADSNATAVSAVQKLVAQNSVSVIFGPSLSSMASAAAPFIESKQVMEMGYGNADDSTKNPFFFRTRVPNAFAGQAAVKYVADKTKWKKVAVIYPTDTSGVGFYQAIKKYVAQYGLDLVSEVSTSPTASDVQPQLLHIKQSGAQAIFDLSHPTTEVAIARENQSMGINLPIIGSLALTIHSVVAGAGAGADGITIATDPIPALWSTEGKAWTAAYEKQFSPEYANPFAGQGYDSVMLIDQAVKAAHGCVTSACIRKGLLQVRDYKGIANSYSFGLQGSTFDPQDGGQYMQVVLLNGGKYSLLSTVKRF